VLLLERATVRGENLGIHANRPDFLTHILQAPGETSPRSVFRGRLFQVVDDDRIEQGLVLLEFESQLLHRLKESGIR
jgi:hypothetical protein